MPYSEDTIIFESGNESYVNDRAGGLERSIKEFEICRERKREIVVERELAIERERRERVRWGVRDGEGVRVNERMSE